MSDVTYLGDGKITTGTVTRDQMACVCPKCGEWLAVGDWPWCPHGKFTPDHLSVVDDSCDMTIENMGPQPIHFTSKAEWRRTMRERGLVNAVQHVGLQGSDKSPHTQRWV